MILSIVFIILVYLFSYKNNLVFMAKNCYGNLILFILCSILGTMSIIYLGKFINNSKLLCFFGKNSMIMLSTQFPVFRAGKELLLFVNNVVCLPNVLQVLMNFIFTCICEAIIIMLINKFFPAFNGKIIVPEERSIV